MAARADDGGEVKHQHQRHYRDQDTDDDAGRPVAGAVRSGLFRFSRVAMLGTSRRSSGPRNALTATSRMTSKAAVRRLVEVTLAGLQPDG